MQISVSHWFYWLISVSAADDIRAYSPMKGNPNENWGVAAQSRPERLDRLKSTHGGDVRT